MNWSSAFNSLTSPRHHKLKKRRTGCSRSVRMVERLEERTLLAGLSGDILVTNNDPVGDGSLAAAVETANLRPGADTIRFADSVRGEIELDDELVIVDDVTIRGPGAGKLTISGGGEHRVFSIFSTDLESPIDVEISRVTIADGRATNAPEFEPIFAFGGGIYNLGSNVTLSRVRMVGNQAEGYVAAGGAVANEFGGSLTIHRSELSGNAVTGDVIAVGGGITSDIGPTLNEDGSPGNGTGKPSVHVSYSSFAENEVRALVSDPSQAVPFEPFAGFALGGALSSFAGDTIVSHSRFEDNRVFGGDGDNGSTGGFSAGGAIFTDDFSPFDFEGPIFGRDSSLDVSYSTFIGNTSSGGAGSEGATGGFATGGAITASIAFFDETASIRHSQFKYNTAVGGVGGEGGMGGKALGGAVAALAGADVYIAKSKFSHNEAIGGDGGVGGQGGDGVGGAIGAGRLITAVDTDLEFLIPSLNVRHTMLDGNEAWGGTGGVGASGGDGNGGALGVTEGAAAEVSRSRLMRNAAVGGSGGVDGQGGDGQGGGVYNSGATTSIARSIVFRNLARAGSGGLGGADGQGLGGGLFNADDDDLLGILSLDRYTKRHTRFNRADDAGDNFFGISGDPT